MISTILPSILQAIWLFLTAEAGHAVLVMDLRANKLIHTIADVDEPHSMLYLPAANQLWVVAGGDGTVKIFDSGTYALIETVKVTDGADSSAYDPAKHLFYIAPADRMPRWPIP